MEPTGLRHRTLAPWIALLWFSCTPLHDLDKASSGAGGASAPSEAGAGGAVGGGGSVGATGGASSSGGMTGTGGSTVAAGGSIGQGGSSQGGAAGAAGTTGGPAPDLPTLTTRPFRARSRIRPEHRGTLTALSLPPSRYTRRRRAIGW